MKQGKRAMAGAVALMGLLATAGPAVAKDRVIAVDGVSKTTRTAAWRSSCTCRTGENANAAAERALAGQGAKKAPKPPEPPQSNSLLVHGPVLGRAAGRRRTTTRPVSAARPRSRRSTNTLPGLEQRVGLQLPDHSSAATRRAARRSSASARARSATTASTTSAGRSCQNGTLGVTWSTSGTDEADMAINTRYTWTTGCTAVPGVVRPRVGDPARERPRRRPRSLDRHQRRDVPVLPDRALLAGGRTTRTGSRRSTSRSRRPAGPVGLRHAPSGPGRAARDPDRALAAAADLLHGVLPAALRRVVQRALPRVPHADGDAVGPGGDPRALHRAPARAAARARRGAAAGRRAALGAAAGGLASTWRGAS